MLYLLINNNLRFCIIVIECVPRTDEVIICKSRLKSETLKRRLKGVTPDK